MKFRSLIMFLSAGIFSIASTGLLAQNPDNATHIPAGEIMEVFEHLQHIRFTAEEIQRKSQDYVHQLEEQGKGS